MPLRIEKESLWKRLATRFKARTAGEEDEGYPVILDTVQPVTNFDDLAKSAGGRQGVAATTGDGNHYPLTVPDGKRWILHAINAYIGTPANGDIDRLVLNDVSGGVGVPWVEFADADNYREILAHAVPLDEGDQIGARVQNRTGVTDLTIDVWIEEEDAF